MNRSAGRPPAWGWICRWLVLVAATWVVLGLLPACLTAADYPFGFVETEIDGTFDEFVGITFDPLGLGYAWDRSGRVWIIEDDIKQPDPLIDISEEVGAWEDYGLLGLALHPNFHQNGYIYLLYVVDHHYLTKFGTPSYNPTANEYNQATIGRLTRYTARASDGFRSVDPSSRTVLIGESISTGFPIMFYTHGVGTLLFGADGTLLASCGDGAGLTDGGSAPDSYYSQALAEGMMRPKENVGAFRAQMVDSLSGKILRLDPLTGDGIPSNPFYDAQHPRSARSRVYALGLRNPYRICLRPGTGSLNRADGNPGVLYIGDVGYFTWEELSVCTRPGQNFGWPIFEGFSSSVSYEDLDPANEDAPNPLFGSAGCTQPFFTFRDLLQEATLGDVSWPNPCDPAQPIPSTIPRFVHTRPAADWKHETGPSRTGMFAGTNAAVIEIGAPGSPVAGPQFAGNCSIGGVWYDGTSFPGQYRGTYFHGDLGEHWIRNFSFDGSNRLVSIRDFSTNAGAVVDLVVHPITGALYFIPWTDNIRKITYVGAGNAPPRAVATSDVTYGPSPLTVHFTGSGSTDPEGGLLNYQWDFGDGGPGSTEADPTHTFAPPGSGTVRYDVSLTVNDSAGAASHTGLLISVNNTPPSVTITSPTNGMLYPLGGATTYQLSAVVTDSEQSRAELWPEWQTVLHHNNHVHTNPVDTNWITTTVLAPFGCDGDTYFYRITLTVTDAGGLSSRAHVDLFPDCARGRAFNGAKINFQPAGAPVPSGYLADTGEVYNLRTNGLFFGWDVDNTANAVDRNSSRSPDQRFDTYLQMQQPGGGQLWEMAVPNGLYSVVAVAGDANTFNSTVYKIDVEGVLLVNGTPLSGNRWISGSNVVTVADGRLSVGNAPGALNNKICFIDVSAPLDAPFRLGWIQRDANGRVTLNLQGVTGRAYQIQGSDRLQSWQTIVTVQNGNGTVSFDDPGSVGLAQRFYRAVFAP